MRYRVDNMPRLWRPIWLAYSWGLGMGGWALLHFLCLTWRIDIEGRENLGGGNCFIYSLWHQFWFLWCVTFVRSLRHHAWMQHPAAYMKPVHLTLQLMGVRVLLGSGGEEGRKAAATLVRLLRQGWSSAISPDGPSGPFHVLKKGVLHIARDSNVPVVPVRFQVTTVVHLWYGDRKLVPLPFAQIRVIFGEPVTVTEENFEEAAQMLVQGMSGSDT
jgi:hypothetical protein